MPFQTLACFAVLTLLYMTNALEITVCDCSTASYLGLLSLATPEYCDSRAVIEQTVEVEYRMFAEEKRDIEWEGYSCMVWRKDKKIVGYFFGSYDTTFETHSVSEAECIHMHRYHTCGDDRMI